MIEITFLRHGRSSADDQGRIEGRFDAPLTEVGHQQARLRADNWIEQRRRFDLIISSPLQRAASCAEVMSERFGVAVEFDPQWMEMDNGCLAGMHFEIADQRFPKRKQVDPFESYVASGDGESLLELYARAASALQNVIRKGSGQYLVISHGGTLNAVFNVIMGHQASSTNCRLPLSDLSYLTLSYQPNLEQWQLQEVMTKPLVL